MDELSLWKNQQMGLLRRDLERLFDRWLTFVSHGRRGEGLPSVDLADSGEGLVVKAEVPGFLPEDLEVNISDEELTVKGRRRLGSSGDSGEGILLESGVQSFSRTIRFPYRVDQEGAAAFYEDGVLTVKIPRRAVAARRRVEITIK